MRTIIGLILLALASSAGARDFSLLDDASRTKCEKCKARCEANVCPKPTPSPVPTPTPAPVPCETTAGKKTFAPGEEKMLCWDMSGGAGFVTIESVNGGNAGCAEYAATMVAPSGARYHSFGAQPMGVLPRMAGRYYFWVKHVWGDPPCNTLTFAVR